MMRAFACALLAGGGLWSADLAAQAPPTSAFARLPDIESVRMSTDGRRLAWIGDYRGRRVVSVYDLDTGDYLRHIEPGDGQTLTRVEWIDDRMILITVSVVEVWQAGRAATRKFADYERYIVYDSDGGPGRALLMGDTERRQFSIADLVGVRAGDLVMAAWDIGYSGRCTEGGAFNDSDRPRSPCWLESLFSVDPRTGKVAKLRDGSPHLGRWFLDPAGELLARTEWIGSKQLYRVLTPGSDGAWQAAYEGKHRFELEAMGVHPDRTSLVAIGTNGGDQLTAWRLPLDGAPIERMWNGNEDVEFVMADRFSGAVIGFGLGGLDQPVHWLDASYGKSHAALARAFPGRRVDIIDRSVDAETLLVLVQGMSLPPHYYLVRPARGTADMVGETYPELSGSELAAARSIYYESEAGLEIPAYLLLPPGIVHERLPLVVLLHDYMFHRDSAQFDWLAQYLATRGYAVLQPQVRGSEGFGAELRRAALGQWGRGTVADALAGIRHLGALGVADQARACIIGRGYGGFTALAATLSTDPPIACAAGIGAVSNLASMYGHLRQMYGDASSSVARWQQQIGDIRTYRYDEDSPSELASRIQVPILLLHAEEDDEVPLSQSHLFARTLTKLAKPHRFFVLPGTGHKLLSTEQRMNVLEYLEDFLSEHLSPKPN